MFSVPNGCHAKSRNVVALQDYMNSEHQTIQIRELKLISVASLVRLKVTSNSFKFLLKPLAKFPIIF